MENYKVVENRSLVELQKSVNKLIELGWFPIGGISNFGDTQFDYPRIYFQTLIKYKFLEESFKGNKFNSITG
jgi:hypothetical protein